MEGTSSKFIYANKCSFFLILELDSRWSLLKVAGRAWHSLILKLLRHQLQSWCKVTEPVHHALRYLRQTLLFWFWVSMMHENASTHHWHIENALQIQWFFSGQKLTGVSQQLSRRNCSSSSFPLHVLDLISSVPTKLIPALSTMHEEKQKALSHLNGKYSEPLEKDKANIKNHTKYAYSTPMYILHTDAHSNFLY